MSQLATHLVIIWLALSLAAGKEEHEKPIKPPSKLGHNTYGQTIHITSGVLQLAVPDEQNQLIVLPPMVPTWPHIYLEELSSSAAHEPRLMISDNLDFPHLELNELAQQQQKMRTQYAQSYGR